jgi:MFS family permease
VKPDAIPSPSASSYWGLFKREPSLLTFGLSFAFLSSFGQTFFVSLFVPSFLAELSLTGAGFGSLYSAATLVSALLIPWAGAWLDRVRLTRFSAAVVALLAISALLLAISWNLAVFFVALVGIRLSGQGLSSHTALTAMARYSGRDRGKALGIANLGFPLGEATLPLLVTVFIALVGWRQSWALVGVLAAVLFGPLVVGLLRRSGVELDPRSIRDQQAAGDTGVELDPRDANPEPSPTRSWNRRQALGDLRFWLVLPAMLLPPFWATGLFLYQTRIAELKGWSLTLMASSFVAFALTRIAISLLAGGTMDRLSARRVFPFSLLPLGLGLVLLRLHDAPWVAYAFMASLGATMGMSATLQTALWAELYGIRHLGAIRAMMSSFMVLSTAASPILTGFVLDAGARLGTGGVLGGPGEPEAWGGLEGLLTGAIVSVAVGTALAMGILVRRGPGPRGIG